METTGDKTNGAAPTTHSQSNEKLVGQKQKKKNPSIYSKTFFSFMTLGEKGSKHQYQFFLRTQSCQAVLQSAL